MSAEARGVELILPPCVVFIPYRSSRSTSLLFFALLVCCSYHSWLHGNRLGTLLLLPLVAVDYLRKSTISAHVEPTGAIDE
jgi:hypothetical protein